MAKRRIRRKYQTGGVIPNFQGAQVLGQGINVKDPVKPIGINPNALFQALQAREANRRTAIQHANLNLNERELIWLKDKAERDYIDKKATAFQTQVKAGLDSITNLDLNDPDQFALAQSMRRDLEEISRRGTAILANGDLTPQEREQRLQQQVLQAQELYTNEDYVRTTQDNVLVQSLFDSIKKATEEGIPIDNEIADANMELARKFRAKLITRSQYLSGLKDFRIDEDGLIKWEDDQFKYAQDALDDTKQADNWREYTGNDEAIAFVNEFRVLSLQEQEDYLFNTLWGNEQWKKLQERSKNKTFLNEEGQIDEGKVRQTIRHRLQLMRGSLPEGSQKRIVDQEFKKGASEGRGAQVERDRITKADALARRNIEVIDEYELDYYTPSQIEEYLDYTEDEIAELEKSTSTTDKDLLDDIKAVKRAFRKSPHPFPLQEVREARRSNRDITSARAIDNQAALDMTEEEVEAIEDEDVKSTVKRIRRLLGSATTPSDTTVTQPDTTVTQPDTTVTQPDTTQTVPDTTTTPQGGVQFPDSQTVAPDTLPITPDTVIGQPDTLPITPDTVIPPRQQLPLDTPAVTPQQEAEAVISQSPVRSTQQALDMTQEEVDAITDPEVKYAVETIRNIADIDDKLEPIFEKLDDISTLGTVNADGFSAGGSNITVSKAPDDEYIITIPRRRTPGSKDIITSVQGLDGVRGWFQDNFRDKERPDFFAPTIKKSKRQPRTFQPPERQRQGSGDRGTSIIDDIRNSLRFQGRNPGIPDRPTQTSPGLGNVETIPPKKKSDAPIESEIDRQDLIDNVSFQIAEDVSGSLNNLKDEALVLINDMQDAFDAFGIDSTKLTLTSLDRNHDVNKDAGGSERSFHLTGEALDIRLDAKNPENKKEIEKFEAWITSKSGKAFLDARGYKAFPHGKGAKRHMHFQPKSRRAREDEKRRNEMLNKFERKE